LHVGVRRGVVRLAGLVGADLFVDFLLGNAPALEQALPAFGGGAIQFQVRLDLDRKSVV
jgi:hypothetical protein